MKSPADSRVGYNFACMKNLLIIAMAFFMIAACTSTPAASTCDRAVFIEHVILDVPVEEGGELMPGTYFTKTWQLLNAGTCDWTEDYALVHTGGDAFGGPKEVPLAEVAAAEMVDFSLRLTAPSQPGTYVGEWMLRNPAGELFGVGPQGDRPLVASLVVPELPTGVVYDFSQVICLARWDSGRATFLPCEGQDDEQGLLEGYVRAAENGTIEVKPNNQGDAWIAGFFPPITIQDGDRFRATVGCVDENPDCDLVFMLMYRVDAGSQTSPDEVIAGNPLQVSAEQTASFDFDLTWLQGNEVTFILYAAENGGRSLEARGYWLNSRIESSSQ
ncbi:MAG: NBR1-Ig-like domain-containing protein [Anaerolineales bacterium]